MSVIGGDYYFEGWSLLGSQRTFGDQMSCAVEVVPVAFVFVTLNRASEAPRPKIGVTNIWPQSQSSFNKQQTPTLF